MASIFGRIALVVLSLLVALGAAEVALRLAGVGSDQFLRQDPVLGLGYIPNKHGDNRGSCYEARVTINSHGWRSGETTWDKPEGVFRVIVLGDSFLGALQVEDSETFSAVAEELFNKEGLSKRVEVINLGVPSFGNDQEYLALREFGKKYNPDFVILAFYAQNDVKNNSIALERRDSTYPKPFFEIRNGALVELPFHDPTPEWVAFVRRLVQPFRLYPWARDALTRVPLFHRILHKLGIVGTVPRDKPEAKRSSGFPGRWGRQSEVFQRNYDDEWLEAWEVTKFLLHKIQQETRAMGARFLLVGVASPISVMPESVQAEVFPAEVRPNLDQDKPTALLRDFAFSSGIDFLPLVPIFRSTIGQNVEVFTTYYLPCDGHWTVAGNRLAAQTVVDRLIPIFKDRLAQ